MGIPPWVIAAVVTCWLAGWAMTDVPNKVCNDLEPIEEVEQSPPVLLVEA